MNLVVDATVSHENFEGALFAPSVVPGVDAEPVVLAVFNTPTDHLDGVATLGGTSDVLVDT